jgi:cbb3-type cytochrome oxidase subunit 3
MAVDLFTVAPGLLGGLLGGYIGKLRIERRMDERERGIWRSLSLRERARTRRHLRRGCAVDDPHLAPVAAELATSLQKQNRAVTIALVAFFAAVCAAVALAEFSDGRMALGAVALALALSCTLAAALMPRRRRRMAQAAAANRRLAAASTPAGGD